ncbi:dihydropteroate synthase [Acetobacter conturbans]|uniref:dihydropteroate synthase n=1 Tax=Acetobacter conturbans TaxID=1737472 RepID=A0ABX0JZ33_9PROT|nr:dihydropteroate synthase [Acetobacter conturbans]NHN88601.1 dihydropteroate synthase [Acetobacter conturbans]
MDVTRLIEPGGILHGPEAGRAIRAGVALPLAGGPTAFTVATLIEKDHVSHPMPVDRIPAGWRSTLETVTRKASSALLPSQPLVMGIVNVTPDSFSDGGHYVDPARAIAHGERLLRDGASILDMGAESTRPNADPVSPDEEWARLQPLLEEMVRREVCISIDTRNASTMEKALNAGATLINDVSALTHDPEAIGVLAARSCPVVLMHMRGTPATMNDMTRYGDVVVDVVRELAARITVAERGGIARTRILIDPGIGFAKTTAQNAEVIRRLPLFANLGCRMVLGTSRKRMIGALTGVNEAAERDPGTIASSLPGLVLTDTILRVHNCSAMTQALGVWEGCFTPHPLPEGTFQIM